MTKEEAVNHIRYGIIEENYHLPKELGIEVCEIAIKALEHEPCEDCISREAVDTLVDELARAISDERCFISRGRDTATIMQDILDLPSVTPQQKTGHWNRVTDNAGYWVWECDKCGWQQRFHTNYCPNCGCAMKGELK